MATFVQDSFTRGNTIDLTSHTGEIGATWTEHTSYSTGAIDAVGSVGRAIANSTQAASYYASGTPATADYDVSATLIVKSTIDRGAGIIARVDTAADTMYRFYYDYDATTPRWRLVRVVAGSATDLGTWDETIADEGTRAFLLELRGTAIKGYVAGVERISVTDSDISAAGKVGLFTLGASGTGAGLNLDDFLAVDAVVSAAFQFPTRDHRFTYLRI